MGKGTAGARTAANMNAQTGRPVGNDLTITPENLFAPASLDPAYLAKKFTSRPARLIEVDGRLVNEYLYDRFRELMPRFRGFAKDLEGIDPSLLRTPNPQYLVKESHRLAIETAASELAAGRYTIGLAGDPGTGKNMALMEIAATLGVAYYEVDCSKHSDLASFLSDSAIKQQRTMTPRLDDPTQMHETYTTVTVAQQGTVGEIITTRPCVVVLNEIVKAPAELQSTLHNLAQDGEYTSDSPFGSIAPFRLHPGAILAFTWNPGLDDKTRQMPPEALLSRVRYCHMRSDTPEELAQQLALTLEPATGKLHSRLFQGLSLQPLPLGPMDYLPIGEFWLTVPAELRRERTMIRDEEYRTCAQFTARMIDEAVELGIQDYGRAERDRPTGAAVFANEELQLRCFTSLLKYVDYAPANREEKIGIIRRAWAAFDWADTPLVKKCRAYGEYVASERARQKRDAAA